MQNIKILIPLLEALLNKEVALSLSNNPRELGEKQKGYIQRVGTKFVIFEVIIWNGIIKNQSKIITQVPIEKIAEIKIVHPPKEIFSLLTSTEIRVFIITKDYSDISGTLEKVEGENIYLRKNKTITEQPIDEIKTLYIYLS